MIKFVVVSKGEVTKEMIDKSLVTSMDSARKSVDGTKVLLKYTTRSMSSKIAFKEYKKYSKGNILKLMDTAEWKIDA